MVPLRGISSLDQVAASMCLHFTCQKIFMLRAIFRKCTILLKATATAKPIVFRSGQSHLMQGNNNNGKKPKCEVHQRGLY